MPPRDNRQQLLDSWLALMEDAPSPEGAICLPVLSGSMMPEIPVNSIVQIEKIQARVCRPGQVVVYRDKDRLVVHRLLLQIGWGPVLFFFEKGDANDRGKWISGKQIKGLVAGVDLNDGNGSQPYTDSAIKARNSLNADLRHRFLAFPRWVKKRLTGGHQ